MKRFPRQLTHPSGTPMLLDPARLLLAFREPQERDAVAARLRPFGVQLEDEVGDNRTDDRGPFDSVNHTPQRFWVRSVRGQELEQERFDALEAELDADLAWIGPVYRLGDSRSRGALLCPLPHVALIQLRSQLADDGQRSMARRFKALRASEVAEKSKYMSPYRYFEIDDPRQTDVYELQRALQQNPELGAEVLFEHMPMLVPITAVPNDTLFAQQWNMQRIQAGGPGTTGWDLSTGAAGVLIAVMDTGCDLTHPDLVYAGAGVNLGSMAGDGAPASGGANIGHGTCCAGIAAASFNNSTGVAGVAGACRILPIAFQNWTDAECLAGINWAAANGADVLSMSFGVYAPGDGFGPTGWNFGLIDPAIVNAVNVAGCVLVAATGNENTGVINRYPGRHPLVIAVGGSDQADNRKTPASADGECWGANFGPGISVVAPCVQTPTTDIQGNAGYNNNNGGPRTVACVNYPSCGDAAGDYFLQFNGTSTATPHVAGLAGALRSLFPTLSNLQVRERIERTADKVGGVYADAPGFPNGTRNAQMGYGRINMFRALDMADVLIKDWPGDTGVEPSTPAGGNFWAFSDVVVRIFDDNVFVPSDPSQSSNVERGQTNYIYVNVTNNGSQTARNVVVNTRITPYVGVEFIYPADWTSVDANHVNPTPITASFASIPAGGTAMAKFSVSATQVEALWGWISGSNWHPCLLVEVNADNDYAFASASTSGASVVLRRNNFAQRNLSVINVLAGASVAFPFLAGNLHSVERAMTLIIDRSRLPREAELLLALDDDGRAFPHVDLGEPAQDDQDDDDSMLFLERTRVQARFGCCRGVLVLEKGSRFVCATRPSLGAVKVEGGELIIRGEQRFVAIREERAVVRLEKQPHRLYPLALRWVVPSNAARGERYSISVAQAGADGAILGGASVVYLLGEG
jgi:subtilisin family serine protease